MLILSPNVNTGTIADINENEYGIILSWQALCMLMPSQLWSSYYYDTEYFAPTDENRYNIANIIWYLAESGIFNKTVYLHEFTDMGEDYNVVVNDIPVKILGVSSALAGSGECYITKKLTDALYNVINTFNTNTFGDILIPYTSRSEISKLYDLFETDAFIRYLKPSAKLTGANYLEWFASVRSNDPNLYAESDDGSGTMLQYGVLINSTAIDPIYKIDETFGLFNDIFMIIAIVLVIIMIILLWSFMSFTIKTRTKDIGILISLGASKQDLAAIFVIEGGLIALGQIIISIISALIAKHYVRNFMIKNMGAAVEKYDILSFGIWQGLTMAGIAVILTAFATALPLAALVKKQPVEIIRKIET
jgi:hypothetical protein